MMTADVWSTGALHDGNSGLPYYGSHGVEMLYALMEPGYARCDASSNPVAS